MRIEVPRVSLAVILLACSTPLARAQFEAPPNSRPLDDTGTLEEIHDGVVQFRDSNNESWWVQYNGETKVTVKGEAEEECLRPAVTYVELSGEIDKKGTLAKPVTEITIIAEQEKSKLGLFTPGKEDEDSKPVRSPGPGTYRIRGRLVVFRDGELVVMAGNRKVSGDIAEKLEVSLNVNDPSIAQSGDEMSIKAWYYDQQKPNPILGRPGKALAEEISIELAKPLSFAGKKSRTADKPLKPAGKAARASRTTSDE
jgi:hypothetical protein